MANHNELNYERGFQAGSQIKMQRMEDIVSELKYYLETNEENGIVYIPKFVIEKLINRR